MPCLEPRNSLPLKVFRLSRVDDLSEVCRPDRSSKKMCRCVTKVKYPWYGRDDSRRRQLWYGSLEKRRYGQ